VFLEKQYRFINFPLRSLRLCEKTVRYTFNLDSAVDRYYF